MDKMNERENKVAQATNDLDFIRKVMQATRYQSLKNGIFYQLWGLLIPLCSIGNWILLRFDYKGCIVPMWVILISLGIISSFLIGYSHAKNDWKKKEGKLNGRVWIGISLGSVAILSLMLAQFLPVVFGLFTLCMLLMLRSVVEASLTGLRGFFAVALGWFLVGIILIVFKEHVGPSFMGLMTFPLSFIPGTILTILYRRERPTD